MSERKVVLDEPEVVDEQAEALRHATERAEKAEAELRKVKAAANLQPEAARPSSKASEGTATNGRGSAKQTGEINTGNVEDEEGPDVPDAAEEEGIEALRQDSMMAHLLDSLEAGKDIGHYGRLVFAMVARHFLPHAAVVAWMRKDRDVDEEKAQMMLKQVEGRDYSPPRRDKILDYQKQQDFPILPNPDDPDCGNLYRNLKFPEHVYEHIGHYQEQKMESGS